MDDNEERDVRSREFVGFGDVEVEGEALVQGGCEDWSFACEHADVGVSFGEVAKGLNEHCFGRVQSSGIIKPMATIGFPVVTCRTALFFKC